MNKKVVSIKNRINENIPYWYKNVRIIGDGIDSRIVSLDEAKNIAKSMGLDLIEINGNIVPPILRIDNYEKMEYEAKKNAKKNSQSRQITKEVQLSANIAIHDLETKVKNAKKFIDKGYNVKVVLTLRGREMSRQDDNQKSILEFITMMEDTAIPMSLPKIVGNKTIVILKKK